MTFVTISKFRPSEILTFVALASNMQVFKNFVYCHSPNLAIAGLILHCPSYVLVTTTCPLEWRAHSIQVPLLFLPVFQAVTPSLVLGSLPVPVHTPCTWQYYSLPSTAYGIQFKQLKNKMLITASCSCNFSFCEGFPYFDRSLARWSRTASNSWAHEIFFPQPL